MKISVIGCGYLGAVHAACMASLGHDVVGVDTDATKIAALSAGHSPFYEPGFEELLTRALGTGRLRFTTAPGDDLADVDLHFIAVGTPQSETGAADLSYVDAAVPIPAVVRSGHLAPYRPLAWFTLPAPEETAFLATAGTELRHRIAQYLLAPDGIDLLLGHCVVA